MPIYQKSEIRKGMYLELDCPIRARIPRYGDAPDQPFAEISDRLDAAKKRLEQIAKDFRNARRA